MARYANKAIEEIFGSTSQLPQLPISPPLPLSAFHTAGVHTPFVVREAELARLNAYLDLSLTGQGQVVFVTGGAGRGKTALLREFAGRAQRNHPDLIVVGGNCTALTGTGDPYLPFRQILALLTGDTEAGYANGIINQEHIRRLWDLLPFSIQALLDFGPDLIDVFLAGAPLLQRATRFARQSGGAEWLIRLDELLRRKKSIPIDLTLQQTALFEQYSQTLGAIARQSPLLLTLDDLQWADPASINLLFHLGRQLQGSRTLIVGAYRPEEIAIGRPSMTAGENERHPLEPVINEFGRNLGNIEIDLSQTEGRLFIDAWLDIKPNQLEFTFRKMLYQQTGGHPLFTIELLRDLQERGDLVRDKAGRWIEASAINWEQLPARVEKVIAERVARLDKPLREMLRIASVEGEVFTAEVITQVQKVDRREVVRRLSQELGHKHRLVQTQALDKEHLSHYRFRHFLFQQYLYHSLDSIERAHLHEDVGNALKALYEDRTEEIAVQLARHFQEAKRVDEAIKYLQQAGNTAMQMSAHKEAGKHFAQALKMLKTLPDNPERIQQELSLQTSLAMSLQAVKGYSAADVDAHFDRALELCRQMEKTGQVFQTWWLSATFYGSKGNHQKVQEIVKQLFNLAQQINDPTLIAMAQMAQGWNRLFLGNFIQARDDLKQVIAFYDPRQHSRLAFIYGQDPGVISRSFSAWILWYLGYPEQALKQSREALALAEKLSHPLSLALARGLASLLYVFCRNARKAEQSAMPCISLSEKRGFKYWLGSGKISYGWALVQQGKTQSGITQIEQGIKDYQASGATLGYPSHLAVLAEAYTKAGQVKKGLARLDEALKIARKNNEAYYEAELHRLKGELLLMQKGAENKAEENFLKAIEVARQQKARSWELRATVSLSRLWQKQDKGEEAWQSLTEIYNCFTEGFETADLKEARALIETLPAPPLEFAPFVVGSPVCQPRQFFGRVSLLFRIFGSLQRPPLRHIAILGLRRSGKTSLLHYLRQITTISPAQLRPNQYAGWLINPKRYRWIFVDFQDIRMCNQERLLRFLLSELNIPPPDPCDLYAFMDAVAGQLRRPTIILMDEIGAGLAASELDQQFWNSLRSLAINQTEGKLSFIVASHQDPAKLARDEGKSSPFFNIFETLFLEPFTEAEARDLIASAPLPFSEADADWIIEQSGLWPSLAQILCDVRLRALEAGRTDNVWQKEGLRQIAQSHYQRLLKSPDSKGLFKK